MVSDYLQQSGDCQDADGMVNAFAEKASLNASLASPTVTKEPAKANATGTAEKSAAALRKSEDGKQETLPASG